MRNAKLLLEQLTKTIPPGQEQRHNLTIDEQGNLVLYLMLGKRYQPVILTEEELDKSANDLTEEICQTSSVAQPILGS